MLHDLQERLGGAAIERLTLLLNHLLTAEPAATERLRGHVSKTLQLELAGWPRMFGTPVPMTFRITPAGLIERCGDVAREAAATFDTPADLRVVVDASNPARSALQAFSGSRPQVQVHGDAALATDLNWLFDNLRWDAEDDLARIVGVLPAREIVRVFGGIAAGLRQAVQTLRGLVARR